LNSEPIAIDLAPELAEEGAGQRIADLLSQAIFAALLTLMFLATVAYGGSDPWWKAFFTSAIFGVGILGAVELMLTDKPRLQSLSLLLPLLALVVFSFLQTIPYSTSIASSLGIQQPVWNAISADPYETRIFALQLLALTVLAALFFRHATTERRLRFLIHFIIGLTVLSAIFGLLRQTTQHDPGFGLPQLLPDQGYGQFINKNHFAYLMEMGFGLALGLVAAGGARRDRALIYWAVMLPIWTALVLSNSRGGILAMVVQVVVTLLLFPTVVRNEERDLEGGLAWRLVRAPAIRLALVACLIAISIIGVLWIGGDRLASNIEAARTEFEKTESRVGVSRTQIWHSTLKMIADHPFAGVGMAGYWTAFPAYHDASGTMTPQQAHNDYLELIASGGVIGLAIFVWFLVLVRRRTRENLRSDSSFRRAASFAAVIALTGVAVHSLVDFGLHRMLLAMTFIALIVIATATVELEPMDEVEEVDDYD